jgi:hypothetical protein
VNLLHYSFVANIDVKRSHGTNPASDLPLCILPARLPPFSRFASGLITRIPKQRRHDIDDRQSAEDAAGFF